MTIKNLKQIVDAFDKKGVAWSEKLTLKEIIIVCLTLGIRGEQKLKTVEIALRLGISPQRVGQVRENIQRKLEALEFGIAKRNKDSIFAIRMKLHTIYKLHGFETLFEECKEELMIVENISQVHIDHLKFTTRTQNALICAYIITVGDILDRKDGYQLNTGHFAVSGF